MEENDEIPKDEIADISEEMFEESPRGPLDKTAMAEDEVTESLSEEPRIGRPKWYD